MIATIVTQTVNAVQVFALIALILFVIATIWHIVEKSILMAIVCAGFVFIAAAVMYIG